MDDELLEFRAEFCAEAAESLTKAETALREAVAEPTTRQSSVEAAFRELHSIKGVAAALGLDLIRDLAHEAESLLARLKDPELDVDDGIAAPLIEAFGLLADMVSALSDSEELDAYAAPAADAITALGAVLAAVSQSPAEALVAKLAMVEEALLVAKQQRPTVKMVEAALVALGAVRGELDPSAKALPAPAEDQVDEPAPAEPAANEVAQSEPEATEETPTEEKPAKDDAPSKAVKEYVRIELGRVDRVFNLVGELLARVDKTSQSDASDPMHRVANELHGAALGLRMVPMEPTFRRLRRVVRDTARLLGRKVDLHLEGIDTEVDRTVAQGITDPLVHIVRNAIDHGIEPPDVRVAAGKPAMGRLTISAEQKAGEVELAISDDGKGIDPQFLLAAAKRKGIIPENCELERSECFRLLFASGFSTAKKVSEVSGRGVGMDVVRKNVEAMRGSIDVESTIGQGSRFTIRLPLSLSSMEAMFFRVGGGVFAIPLHSVFGVIRTADHTVITAHGKPASLRIRGSLYPFVHVAEPNTSAPSGLIIEDRDRKAVVPVDQVLGPAATIVKTLGSYLGTVPRVAGCTMMKSGEIALLLDPRLMMDAVFGLASLAA
ncbi:MAG: chemotaxis protein CheA [Nannocystaceae bacterium]|nr:chemotaxis protein CheA [bacterium]